MSPDFQNSQCFKNCKPIGEIYTCRFFEIDHTHLILLHNYWLRNSKHKRRIAGLKNTSTFRSSYAIFKWSHMHLPRLQWSWSSATFRFKPNHIYHVIRHFSQLGEGFSIKQLDFIDHTPSGRGLQRFLTLLTRSGVTAHSSHPG